MPRYFFIFFTLFISCHAVDAQTWGEWLKSSWVGHKLNDLKSWSANWWATIITAKKAQEMQGPTKQYVASEKYKEIIANLDELPEEREPKSTSYHPPLAQESPKESVLIPYGSKTRRSIQEKEQLTAIGAFLTEAYKFYSDIKNLHYHYAHQHLNNAVIQAIDKDFKKLNQDHASFIKSLEDPNQISPLLAAIARIFADLQPLAWHYFDTITPFAKNPVDDEVLNVATAEGADTDFLKRLRFYKNNNAAIGTINTQDQSKLLALYRKYQLDTAWKNLHESENRTKVIKALQQAVPQADLTWIRIY